MFMMSSSKGWNLVGDPQLPAPGVTAPHQVSNRLLPSDSQPSPAGGSAASARVLGLRVTHVTRRGGGATLCPAPSSPAGEGRAELQRPGLEGLPGSWAGAQGTPAQVSTRHRPRRNSSTSSSDPNSHNVSASAGFRRPPLPP